MIDLNSINLEVLKNASIDELITISQTIREFLIDLSTKKEIHLSSNLGIVELTISLLRNFDLTTDKLVYDTGHQTYIHKILTGRLQEILNMRTEKTLGGLMIMGQSSYDHYSPGHSGNTISVLCGMYSPNNFNICLIGDSSIASGISFEGLNYIGYHQLKIIIVLNDNGMSISSAVGALSLHLSSNINPISNFFTSLNFRYIGPINGHDLVALDVAIKKSKELVNFGPVVLHVKTIKGKGMVSAENDRIGCYHTPTTIVAKKFGDIAFLNLSKKITNRDLVLINPAMNYGSGFSELIKYPNYHDVGISEEHALSMASGFALLSKKVFVLMYSTFLQRGYDQLLHDCARLKTNITILLDRSDIAPHEGDSHHGIFDIGFATSFPNTRIFAPRTFNQLDYLIDYCYNDDSPTIKIIRYPTKPFLSLPLVDNLLFDINSFEYLINNQNNVCVLTFGPYSNVIYNELTSKNIKSDLISMINLTNISENQFSNIFKNYKYIIVYERIYNGYISHKLFEYGYKYNLTNKIIPLNYQKFLGVGTLKSIDSMSFMDINNIIDLINNLLK